MGKVEKFTVGAALLGLLVDLIALGQFSGYSAKVDPASGEVVSVFKSIIILILIFYSLILLGTALITYFGKLWSNSEYVPSESATIRGVNVAAYIIVVPVFSIWAFLSSESFREAGLIPIGIVWWFGSFVIPLVILYLSKSLVVLLSPQIEASLYAVVPFPMVCFEDE